MLKFACVAGALMMVAAPAVAQTPSEAPAQPTRKAADPNRIICEREEQIGSRLSAKKVCLTAREWQMRRQEMREDLERYQRESASPRSG